MGSGEDLFFVADGDDIELEIIFYLFFTHQLDLCISQVGKGFFLTTRYPPGYQMVPPMDKSDYAYVYVYVHFRL